MNPKSPKSNASLWVDDDELVCELPESLWLVVKGIWWTRDGEGEGYPVLGCVEGWKLLVLGDLMRVMFSASGRQSGVSADLNGKDNTI